MFFLKQWPGWTGSLRRLAELLKPPPPNASLHSKQIRIIERRIMLPVKLVFMVVMVHYLYFTQWVGGEVFTLRQVAVELIQKCFGLYVACNVTVGMMLLMMDRIRLQVLRWGIFVNGLFDGVLLAALTLLTNGFESPLYWVFPALIIRNAIALPLAVQQVALNCAISLCFLVAGVLDVAVKRFELISMKPDLASTHLLGLSSSENTAELLMLRLIVLFLTTFVCYGVQVLFEKQRLAEEEGREFTVRQEQLSSAGRLAAEIAHQLKNPLAIINNASFNLQRQLKDKNEAALGQAGIIREEVERADRIITELMGYSKLSHARVERLDVIEELDRAVAQVFPPEANYPVKIVRQYAKDLPPLTIQRGHLAEIFVNILQNARDVMAGGGELGLEARLGSNQAIEVVISDTGPGIPPERREQIFEVYYTTKPKGTGLGLSIVRHSLDIYGGEVKVESELGKGSRFIVKFPAKSMQKPW